MEIADLNFETLEIGDYLCGKIVIERKSFDFLDFKRVKTQANLLRVTYGDNAFLVVDRGLQEVINESKKHFKVDMRDKILGMVASLAVRDKMVPIFCDNTKNAAYIIKALCIKGNDNKKSSNIKLTRPQVSKKDKEIYYMASLPGLEEKMAKRLLAHFTTIQNIANAEIDELMEVENIGKKTATNLYNTFRGITEED